MRRKIAGILATVRRDRASARALAVADNRTALRAFFLSSVVRSQAYRHLQDPITRADLAKSMGVALDARFEAWVEMGLATKELGEHQQRLVPRGRRLLALANEDADITACYRNLLTLHSPLYNDPLGTAEDHTITDQDIHRLVPDTTPARAYTSLVARSALIPTIREALAEAPNDRFLDVGCFDGGLTQEILRIRPSSTGVALDSDPALLALTKQRLNERGWGERVETKSTSLPDLPTQKRFGLILLTNQLCAVGADDRATYMKHVAELLEPGGFVVVTSLTIPGSTTASGVNFYLQNLEGNHSLLRVREIDALLKQADLGVAHRERVLPGRSLYSFTAFKGWF